jgi:acetoin utilization protein AcuB
MIKQVISVTPDTPILKAGGVMLAHGVHRLPVVENGRMVGIVTRDDVYTAVLVQHLAQPK